MNAVPILAGGQGHTGNGKILIQLVKGGAASAPSGTDHAGPHLHGQILVAAIEQAVQEGNQGAVGGGIVNRAGYDHTVCQRKQLGRLVHAIVKDAFPQFSALITGDTPPDVLHAHIQLGVAHTVFIKNLLHFPQGNLGIAALSGASVENQNLH